MNEKQLHQEILELAKKNLFSTEIIFEGEPAPIIALKKASSNLNAPRVYISAGMHGNEPAGPLVIKKLLEEGFFGDKISWTLIPMINATGLELGTRENADGIDLNRDYKDGKTPEVAAHLKWFKAQGNLKYDLSINLHEDWESPGFYCYAVIANRKHILTEIYNAVKSLSPINLSTEIEGLETKGGFITIDPEDFKKMLTEWTEWPEAFFLIKNNPNAVNFTFETASEQPMDQRVATHCAAIKAATEGLLRNQ